MQVISIINYKGGVGKTTITANIATELAWRGENVLLIDMDPQASLTFSFVSVDEWESAYAETSTIKNWYDAFIEYDRDLELAGLVITPGRANQAIRNMSGEGRVDLICSHLALINVDLELATRLGGASMRQSRDNFLTVHSRLVDGLSTPGIEDYYDYVLIDCPPNFNVVTKTAIVASDKILVPAIPDHLSTIGIEQLQRHVRELITDFNDYAEQSNVSSKRSSGINPSVMGVVFTMVRLYNRIPVAAQRLYIDRIKSRSGLPVFDTFIRRNDSIYGKSPEYGTPIVVQDVSGTYLDVRGELENLTTEFLDKL